MNLITRTSEVFLTIALATWLTLFKNVRSQLPTPANSFQCPESCNRATAPCECYRDGWVDCDNQAIESISLALPKCVIRLVIKNNAITSLASSRLQGLGLTTLEIRFEPFDEVPSGVFANLSQLATLTMENNRIQTIANDAFSGLISLNELSLDSNRISIINSRSFYGMPKLTSLSLKNNNIAVIGAGTFDGLQSLHTLNVFNNSLSELHVRWFEQKPNLTIVNLSLNQWNCTCTLQQRYQFISTNFHLLEICPIRQFCIVCHSPNNFRGQSLNAIQFPQFPSCSPPINATGTSLTDGTTTIKPTTTTESYTVPSATTFSDYATLNSSIYLQTTEKNFKVSPPTSNVTVPSESSTPTPISGEHLPVWSIILIIVLLLIILITTTIIAVLCIRRPEIKVEHSPSRIELQPNNLSVKSLEIEIENC